MKGNFHGARLRIIRAASVTALALATFSCSQSSGNEQSRQNEPADPPQTVSVARVTRQDLSRGVTLTAEFKPYQEVEIHAKVAGYVKQINVDVGDHAKAGDVLATLEIPEIEDQLKQADAAILTAQENVKSMEASYDESSLIANRLGAAAQETKGLIAQQDVDTANDKNRADEANLAAAKQKVTEAQANADHLRDLVAYSKIIAPFDGVITRRFADAGALVQAGTVQAGTSGNSNSMPLVSFAELNRLRLEFPVPESAVAFVHVGSPVEITVVSMGKTFSGAVTRFAQKVDTDTRTMLTEVDVDNPDFRYTPGMYATVRLILAEKKNALAVPIQCVSTGDKSTVLLLDQDHKVKEQEVTLGLETPTMAEILSGLNEGDLIVVGSRSSIQIGQVAVAKDITEHNL
jgi:RND family efflux transporter MFP subunit